MANIFDGDWSSSIVPNGDERRDGTFHIEVDPQNNKLEPLSNHNGRPITGRVGRGSRFNAIIINEENPRVRYKGSLIVDGASSIISGFQDLNPDGLLKSEAGDSEKSDPEFFDQLQEVWVATKP